MLLSALDPQSVMTLNEATDGLIAHVLEQAAESVVHLTVQTHFEGLPQGEMKLFVSAGAEVVSARLVSTGALVVGWNIFLTDTLTSAREHLKRAERKIALAIDDNAADNAPRHTLH